MRSVRKSSVVLVLACALATPAAAQQVVMYRCTDVRGVVTLQNDTPCAKGLKQENLRDNMTNTELVLNMLAEVAATDISLVRNPQGLAESAEVAAEGAQTAKAARLQLEKSTGQPVVSRLNARKLGTRKIEGKK